MCRLGIPSHMQRSAEQLLFIAKRTLRYDNDRPLTLSNYKGRPLTCNLSHSLPYLRNHRRPEETCVHCFSLRVFLLFKILLHHSSTPAFSTFTTRQVRTRVLKRSIDKMIPLVLLVPLSLTTLLAYWLLQPKSSKRARVKIPGPLCLPLLFPLSFPSACIIYL